MGRPKGSRNKSTIERELVSRESVSRRSRSRSIFQATSVRNVSRTRRTVSRSQNREVANVSTLSVRQLTFVARCFISPTTRPRYRTDNFLEDILKAQSKMNLTMKPPSAATVRRAAQFMITIEELHFCVIGFIENDLTNEMRRYVDRHNHTAAHVFGTVLNSRCLAKVTEPFKIEEYEEEMWCDQVVLLLFVANKLNMWRNKIVDLCFMHMKLHRLSLLDPELAAIFDDVQNIIKQYENFLGAQAIPDDKREFYRRLDPIIHAENVVIEID